MATIMIVDDSATSRSLLATVLGDSGHRLLEATNGAKALEIVRAERPDLVITDLLMPTMDGYELVRQLRMDTATAGTPVIFYTATYHEHEARSLAKSCAVARVLAKPAEPEELIRTVDAALAEAAPLAVQSGWEEFDREHLRLVTDKLAKKANELERSNAQLTLLSFENERSIEALRASEERIHSLLNSTAEAIYGLDLDGRCTFCNTAFLRILGYDDSADLLGKHLHVLIHHARADGSRCLENECRVHQVLRTGEGVHADNERFCRRDGTSFPVEFWSHPVLSDGQFVGAVVTFLDISERKQAEQRSRTRHAVTEILEASPSWEDAGVRIIEAIAENLGWEIGVVWHVDDQADSLRCFDVWHRPSTKIGEFEDVTRSLTFVAGIGIPGQVWQSRRAVWVADLAQTDFPRAQHAARIAIHADWGFPIFVENEVLGVLEFFSHQFVSPDDEFLKMMMTIGNQIGQFIERKRAEENLRLTRHHLQHVLNASPVVIYTLQVKGSALRPTFISENIVRLTGYTAAEALRPGWWEANLHPDDRSGAQADLIAMMSQETSIQEYRTCCKNGTYRWVLDERRLVKDGAGQVEVIGSWTDIDERKKLEQRFQQAQKMEAFGQLAGGVAHDFNNLLTVIIGFSEIVLPQIREDESIYGMISEIHKAGERAAGLTRQLLAFSRKQIIAPVVLDLNDVVRDMEKMLGRLIGEDITLAASLDPRLGQVKADSGQIEQVIMNLVVNARDAMPRGGRLTIETHNTVLDEAYAKGHPDCRPGRYVLLAVSDTGHGMDPETMKKVFEPFFTTKEVGKGTGLGLATVYGIVKQSNGHVAAYSEQDRGATFKVYLPRVADEAAPKPRSEEIRGSQGHETLLLVEDEEGVRTLARVALESFGYRVLEATDGVVALDLMAKCADPIQLLITDVVMPHMSGRELADRMATLNPGMKILFLSGYTDDAVVRHGVLESGVAFLQKPFTPESLSSKVREVLDQRV